ncbi:Molybdopterin biosynthesis MoeA protein [Roseomonas mucosa]|uniref:molybdopterin molybdotransferase MoeA n=1 Tax=Roseomonas TaxID=125216 RepID=UPI000C1A4DE5|nr:MULTISPECIES: gephyrin-like molybdotransferase Glp [Roseomonas]ATR20603.1 molybdopterin molybdenumtransferase MoeA [Roseomonas sp. FDAARGOS_362]MDT8274757.1 molybdopterin molybdotransferase MoeA [Roseomonas mucosa]QDJ09823.1 Molybdopterin biosynthesis MoeA protein [Roseomonas mucosa]UZO97145.1 Molybdopterin biosynthesis MoeA protein [Roseomonas mucosa]
MARLSNDCFASGDGSLTLAEAEALIARLPPLAGGAEAVPLLAARGRVLAEDIAAPIDLPPFGNSAMDGYAFAGADLGPEGGWLPLAGRVAAGDAAAPLPPGHAVRILTGAPLPPGADTVMMQEDARAGTGRVFLPPGLPPGANIRHAGEDLPTGALALPKGRLVAAPEIALAAALGLAALPVTRRPRLGVFSTGSELVAPGGRLGPAQAHDSNRFMLLSLLANLPVEAVDLGLLPDRRGETEAALREAALSHDMLLTSGGVSTGEEDHVRRAMEATGSLAFWRLAVKPGRPLAMGVVEGRPVMGLPGNPVAALLGFLHLARPLALHLAGAAPKPLPRFELRAGFSHRKLPGRREYLRVAVEAGPDGPVARKPGRAGAGQIASLLQSDAFAELPEDMGDVAPGDRILVLPFAGLF